MMLTRLIPVSDMSIAYMLDSNYLSCCDLNAFVDDSKAST